VSEPPDDTYDLVIDRLTAGGDGTAALGSTRLLVPFTLPGERVRVRLPKGRHPGGGPVTARLVEVLRASRHRVTPPCPHFGPAAAGAICGGCAWQHIAYPEQLVLKTALVQRLVDASVDGAPRVAPTLPGVPLDHPWGFRNKVHVAFGRSRDDAKLVAGHYARGTRRVIQVDECRVQDPAGDAFAHRLSVLLARAVGRSAAVDQLRHIVVRVARRTGEMMATLVVTHDGGRDIRDATRRTLAKSPQVTSFHLNEHPEDDGFLFGDRTRRISGTARMREDVAGTAFLLSPDSFFQTNVRAAELLVELVLAAIPDGTSPVLDLFAGAGLFALPLAQRGHHVTAIEENPAAVEDGLASQRLQRDARGRCTFVCAPVETALRRSRRGPPPTVILDPPRDGCPEGVIETVFGGLQPDRAIYISCNPEALAYDLSGIVSLGYQVTSLQPVDMFPHTPHIETVAILDRQIRN